MMTITAATAAACQNRDGPKSRGTIRTTVRQIAVAYSSRKSDRCRRIGVASSVPAYRAQLSRRLTVPVGWIIPHPPNRMRRGEDETSDTAGARDRRGVNFGDFP